MILPLRSILTRGAVAALALTIAVAGPADAASKHRRHKSKRAAATTMHTPKRTPAPVPAAAPAPAAPAAPAAAPAVTSVISIGGFVFYNLTYAEAVAAYQAAIAAGATPPPPVTSVSVTTTVGGTSG